MIFEVQCDFFEAAVAMTAAVDNIQETFLVKAQRAVSVNDNDDEWEGVFSLAVLLVVAASRNYSEKDSRISGQFDSIQEVADDDHILKALGSIQEVHPFQ